MNSTLKSLLFWMVLVVVGVLVWNFSTRFQRSDQAISFSTFMTQVETGQVSSVTITGNEIAGVAEDQRLVPDPRADPVRRPGQQADRKRRASSLAKDPTTSPWATLLYSWAPILLLIGFWIFFMRQMQSGGNKALSFGKSKAKLSSSSQKKVTFKDVAGVDEAKDELQEIIEFLREPQKFQKLGGRIPKGVLLMGPPGTGKTLLARAVAGEANVPFFSISGSDFVEMFVGVGASRVRDLFEQGKKNAPCIVFIDEIDAVGPSPRRRPGRRARRARADAEPAARRDGRLREQRRRHPGGRDQPARTCSIRRCCVPAVSTAASWSTVRT